MGTIVLNDDPQLMRVGWPPYEIDQLSDEQLAILVQAPVTDERCIIRFPLSPAAKDQLRQRAVNAGGSVRGRYIALSQRFSCLREDGEWLLSELRVAYAYEVDTPDFKALFRTTSGLTFVQLYVGDPTVLSAEEYEFRTGSTPERMLDLREVELQRERRGLEEEVLRIGGARKLLAAHVVPARLQVLQEDGMLAAVDWAVIEGLPTDWRRLPVGIDPDKVISVLTGE